MIKERKIESIRFETKAVIYQNETGFKILAGVAYNADSGEMLRKCSLKGQLSDVEDGDTLFVSGDWDEHPKYGVGFRAEAYVKAVPQDKKSMLAYLKHGNIAGISAKRAELIIDKFGDNAFDVLIYQPHLLEGIRGIGKKTIEKIKVSAKDKLETQNMIAQIMRYIQGFDISPAYSNKIYKQYGLDSIKVLKENPYRLADDIAGVGFLKADEIALKNGISETSPFRVESAVLYILRQMNKEGDVFSYIQDIEAEGKEFLKLDKSYIDKAVESLVGKKRVIREDDAVYLTNLFKAEEHAAKRIVELIANNTKCIEVTDADVKRLEEEEYDDYVKKYKKEHGNNVEGLEKKREYADKQREAIIAACKSDVLILTGGPGTGKTTTVNGIIKMLKKHGLSVLCAAPTGRAAKRMEEATHHKSMTIHRTLEVKSEGSHGFKFSKNETNHLEGDALIIDESSMIDMSLLDSVLKAIPNGMKLILVGDIDQLLSVGCGNVLYEMIHSGKVPVVRLKAIFRQDEESGIVVNAHKINRGEIPLFKNRKEGDYFFMNVDDMEQEQIRDSIVDYVCDKLPKYYNIPANEIQVLSPMRKGHTGVWELNSYIQNRLNPPAKNKPVIPCNEQVLRLGDKVMFTCNDYDKNIFNGDIGKIVSIFSPELDAEMGINDDEMDDDIDKDEREGLKRGFIVDFDGNRVCFDNSRASDFILAYAITIHKSQGSEYDIVVMPLTMANYTMLQRNLLYTAVTRAKKIFVLFGQKNAVAKAVKNLKVVKRNTRLGLRIVNQMGLLDMMQPENVQLSIDGCGDPRPCLIHASVARGIMAV